MTSVFKTWQPCGARKRNEVMTVTFPAQDKKRRSQEAFRSSEHGPVKEGKEQPHPRNMDRRGYKFFNKDMKDMYDELLKHDKIIH